MTSYHRTYRLPDEKQVIQKKYFSYWRGMCRKVEKTFGVHVIGCDPGFLVASKDQKSSCDLPLWLVTQMIEKEK